MNRYIFFSFIQLESKKFQSNTYSIVDFMTKIVDPLITVFFLFLQF